MYVGAWLALAGAALYFESLELVLFDGVRRGHRGLCAPAIHPNWLPDGRRLAYCTDDDLAPPRKNPAEIKIIDLSTGVRRVLISGGVNTYPAFSPECR